MTRTLARLSLEQLEDRLVPSITYHGGPVLPHVEVEGLYYGSYWGGGAGALQASDLNTYLGYLANSSYMDMLVEYGVGRGTLVDNGVADPGISGPATVDDSQIRAAISADITGGFLQAPDRNRLYIIFTPPSVVVTSGSQSSTQDFYGYHDSFIDSSLRVIRYAVIVHPTGNGDAPGLNDFQTMTWVVSHELAESVTNPDNGGWFDSRTGDEIGDLCNGVDDRGLLNGYVIQAEWSVSQNACVLPADAQDTTPVDSTPSSALRYQVAFSFLTRNEGHRVLIISDYQLLLGRTPSEGEISGWRNAMQNGLTDEQLLASFASTPEYYQRAGNTDQAWLEALYHDLLGRAPASQAKVDHWLSLMTNGMSRWTVAYEFACSPEHESRVITGYYETYLGRTPNAGDVAVNVAAFDNGASNEQIAAAIVSSDEFYVGQGNTVETFVKGLYQTIFRRPADKAGFDYWDVYIVDAL
jgi:hypothetical protein